MKKVTGLNDRPEHFEPVPDGAEHLFPTFRTMLVKQLATAKPRPDQLEDAITHVDLALKIKNTPVDFIEIEDTDFSVLEAAVKSNRADYNGFYQGQLCKRLKSWSENATK